MTLALGVSMPSSEHTPSPCGRETFLDSGPRTSICLENWAGVWTRWCLGMLSRSWVGMRGRKLEGNNPALCSLGEQGPTSSELSPRIWTITESDVRLQGCPPYTWRLQGCPWQVLSANWVGGWPASGLHWWPLNKSPLLLGTTPL